ncbi:MAG: hypothetical protein R3C01_12705 [Planctomycetaceae bacterium]
MRLSVRVFLEQMWLDGHVRVDDDQPAKQSDVHDAAEWAVEHELSLREHLAYEPPAVSVDCLAWAIRQMYGAAQLAVFRQLGAEEIPRRFNDTCPENPVTATTVYSVDLVFRFLPDVVRIVKAMNPDDPLLHRLLEWGSQWPLSSVGISGVTATEIEPILGDRCLSMMYADRIIRTEATDRLLDRRVREFVGRILDPFPELSPKLHSVLQQSEWDQ